MPWYGVVDAARERNINLICFLGGELRNSFGFVAQANVLYDLVDGEQLDGLILWTGGLDTFVSPAEMVDFCAQYRSLPIVSVEHAVAGVPSILMDDYQAMREVMVHLIEVHGYQHIAFLPGSEFHLGMRERYRAYVETLAEYGLPFDSDLVFPSFDNLEFDASDPRAVAILTNWLQDRQTVKGEALVAHNDVAALRSLQALQSLGIQVPGDMALTGFDDIAESRVVTPPLTTVRPPFYEMGQKAVETLLALIDDQDVPEQVVLTSELVVRRSCGCSDPTVTQATAMPVKVSEKSLDTVLADQREEIITAMTQVVGTAEPNPGRMARLLDGFVADIKGRSQGHFLHELDEVLCQERTACDDSSALSMVAGQSVGVWQGVVSALRYRLLPYLDGEVFARAEDLWQQARLMIGEAAERAQAYQVFRANLQTQMLRRVSQALITTFDVEQLMDVLAEDLPRLGFRRCYLSLYQNPQPYAYPQPAPPWSRLILAYNEQGRVELEPGGWHFPSSQLIPGEMWPQDRRYTFVVESLYFRDEQLGFALFEVGPRETNVYEELRGQISSALKGALLLQEHKQIEAALARQAQELTRSNVELEQFAYVASHDLQEPLRMVKSYLQLLERRYQDKLDSDANEFIAFAVDGATRMGMLINDLLKYSRVGTQGKPFEPTACPIVLEQVLNNLKVAIKESEAVVTWTDLPTVMADEVQLIQVLQNLIGNALKFRQPDVRPEIHVGVERKDGEWVFSVQDNGIGIDPQYFRRLFMIFKRLHARDEYPGTGIGLAICKKIVERHGGRIWIESDGVPGQGATFYFTLPERRNGAS